MKNKLTPTQELEFARQLAKGSWVMPVIAALLTIGGATVVAFLHSKESYFGMALWAVATAVLGAFTWATLVTVLILYKIYFDTRKKILDIDVPRGWE